MRFDFGSVDDVESFVSVPEGVHRCRIAEVREGRARDGSVRWSFRVEVLEGEYAGRTAAWDSVTWSERGVYRVKKLFSALGLDVRGELVVNPADLIDLRCQVRVEPEEREDPVTGRRQVRMRVPYLGYARLDAEAGPAALGGADCECRECSHRFAVAHVARCPKCDSRYLQTLAFTRPAPSTQGSIYDAATADPMEGGGV